MSFRVPGKQILDNLCVDCRGEVFLQTVPHIEQEDSTTLEHPTYLPEYRLLVGNKHDAEGADHRAELARAEGQAGRVRLAPFDALVTPQLVARVVQHCLADVAGEQPARRIDVLPQSTGHQPGSAGDLQHVARQAGRQALREIQSECVEPCGSQTGVVILRNRSAIVCAWIDHTYPYRSCHL